MAVVGGAGSGITLAINIYNSIFDVWNGSDITLDTAFLAPSNF